MKPLLCAVAAFAAFSSPFCKLQAEETVRVVGSDLLQDILVPYLEQLDESRQDLAIEVALDGSSLARRSLLKEAAELAIIAVPPGQTPPENTFAVEPFAFEVVTLAVNESNPLQEISIEQVQGVFSSGAAEDIDRWGQLGLTGTWTTRKITPNVIETKSGIGFELFQHVALNGAGIRQGVSSWENPGELLSVLREDDTVLAVLPTVTIPGSVKVLRISQDADSYAHGPTEDSVFYGDYPLRLPFYVAYRQDQIEAVRPILQALLSDEMAEILRDEGLVPVPSVLRRDRLLQISVAK